MPYLPGGSGRQVELLDHLLEQIDANGGHAAALIDRGDGVERPIREVVRNLTASGLLTRADRDQYAVSEEARGWRQSGDPIDLIKIFHRHIRLIGELLYELSDGPRTVRELTEVAAEKYQLPWTTLDQVRRRLGWFIGAGMVEYKTNTQVWLTDTGRHQLDRFALGGPETPTATQAVEVDAPELPAAIAAIVDELTPAALSARRAVLGYVPRGATDIDIVQSLTLLVNACSPTITRHDLMSFAQQKFAVAESSFGSVLTTLTMSGLVEQSGFNIYSPTPEGSAWLEEPTALNLALIFHARYLFVLEIIPLLSEFDKAPDLARAAHQHYGFGRVDVGGIRTRLQILKAAGLIYERANWRYQATPLGERLVHDVALQEPYDADVAVADVPGDSDDATSQTDILCQELHEAALAADTPVRLEKAVADAFAALGFDTRHIGGGGKTDVIATVNGPDLKPVRVIIDAKAARSGLVNENAVSFDTLAEHKKSHEANFVALVGPSFESGRVRSRAESAGVELITTDRLAQVLRRHAKTPRSASTYLGLVDPSLAAKRVLENGWSQAERRVELLTHVVAVLDQEARQADEVTHGALSADQIYLIVRDEIDPRPSPKDIESVLSLLEHPLIESVQQIAVGSGKTTSYHLVDSKTLITEKIAALARSIGRDDAE
ncbi:restriction endonuclease [Rhodococcus sp. NPDC059968]|uniref:restriction endonuclease n=1 Tax=Rhodococcus sp. NPDC059968 TaxID=3347017 RepID=UPI00366EBF82